jgi:EAL domain-containing protein (putative c-di-GMP-specific phosphodiesterase class I)/FixJ family two-component response regulator
LPGRFSQSNPARTYIGVTMNEQRRHLKRLLVLDDESDVAATICRMAETASYETEHTDDADVFFEKVLAWQPSHVAIDLQLGNLDGIEVIHKLSDLGCQAAVIIISGLGGRILDSSARAAAENGLRLIGTLSKPFPRSALLALLTVGAPTNLPGKDAEPAGRHRSVSREQLTEALNAKAFVAHFQPKISCADGELVGFECLARWPQQNGSVITPDAFVGLAEQTGQIHELTRPIYHRALANLPERARQAGMKVALNLSPTNLNDQAFPRWLMDKCREHGIAASQVILEVTETAGMDSPLTLLENLTQFRIRGFHLSIDDFGVGYSSLVQLARLPFSELKIDRMFVRSLSYSEESRKIVTALVGLGHSLGLNVVAEGLEDAQALGFLRDIGCDEAQGHFIAAAMNTRAANAWAERSRNCWA